ncbi:LacI family DNA-binding transcriptional regulator [Alkalibacterium sp. MB6]|uniref:LacI family DNA-binding transcriptional regulator n=1 Tax=Alkalibacterium sp. MB6 TaxID=2081965 RepID=UPI00137AD14C|nr:LacI family DNA-binding transcriptional regulator [Alkalibacterium sp. MB6]
MVTINDIAKKAGVAKSTVSRYLNNGSISSETKKIIEAVIEETGYMPNTFARSLKAQRTNMLGMIIPRLSSASTNEVLEGVDAAARELGYHILITNSDQSKERELANIQTLAKQKVEGIIMLAREITNEHEELIKNTNIPFLLIGQRTEGIHSIIHQDYEAGYKIGQYAVELGHRHFLYVGVPEYDKAVGVERKKGFLDAVSQHEGTRVDILETEFSRSISYEKAKQSLPKTKATYIACATDNIAVAVLKATNELGYSIPGDFSLSGFGGYDATSYVTPTITTVGYPYRNLGEEAVLKMHKLITKEAVPMLSELSNSLLIKQSTREFKKNRKGFLFT